MRQRAILILLFILCAVLPAVAEYRPHTDLTLEIGGHPVVTSDTDKLTRRVMAFSDERVRITVRLFYGVGVTETGKHEGTSVLSFREPWWKLLRWQMQDEYGNVLTFAPQNFRDDACRRCASVA